MTVLRRFARPMLASSFITAGYDAVRDPARPAPEVKSVVEPVASSIAPRTSLLPENPEQLVRLAGAVQLSAGVLLALGRLPRLASLALAAALVPTTLAAPRYWTIEDPAERAEQRLRFLKNTSMLGGLLLAAADTHGKPSLAYRTRSAAGHASDAVAAQAHAVADHAHVVAHRIGDSADAAVDATTAAAGALRKRLP
jgi:putative oxidoreductase